MNLDQLLTLIAFVAIGTSIAIPLIQSLMAHTHNTKILQLEAWALQVVKNVNGVSSSLTGASKKEEAIKQLDAIVAGATQKFNVTSDDISRYIESAYQDIKEKGGV